MSARPVIDVSDLPSIGFDTRSPLWWGNTLLLFIETTMFGILIASYFYTRINFVEWPPPHADRLVFILDPLPGLVAPIANVVLMLLSLAPMIWIDRAARRRDASAVRIGLVIMLLMLVGTIVLRAYEFPALKFKWNDNAYASCVWTILGTHLLHLIVATGETVIMTTYVFLRGLDDKHALDLTLLAVYWYWVVGIWLPMFAIVFIGPQFSYAGPRVF